MCVYLGLIIIFLHFYVTKRLKNRTRPSRALCGQPLWGAANDPSVDRNYPPGQHGVNNRGFSKQSDYGLQLRAKQKLKKYYGDVTERQFSNTFRKASKKRGDTIQNFIGMLESRLDAVIYHAVLVPSIFAARQTINHGHITVNGKRVKIASYQVQEGDVIAIHANSVLRTRAEELLAAGARKAPEYLQVNAAKLEVVFAKVPTFEEVPYPVMMEPHLVLEYYSRG